MLETSRVCIGAFWPFPGSAGDFNWGGYAGTFFWVDPKEQLVGIYMVQASADDTRFLRNQFRSMVQAAIAD